jgi:ribosomal protein S18 acetylase RimI-like enzyme
MLRIQPATGERLQPALDLLYSALPADEKARRLAEARRQIDNGEIDPRRLLLAEVGSSPVGAQLTILRDDVGMVWPPAVSEPAALQSGVATAAIEDALLDDAVRQLDASNAWIGQSLLEPHQLREQAALQRNAFTRLTELRFFERVLPEDSDRAPPQPTSPLPYEPYRQSRNRLTFVNALEATYRGSLDCPEFNGVRDARQSLKNHEATGTFSSDMWRLYRRDGNVAGVLLLVERPDQRAWEVLYLGVVPAARRSGLGRAMLLDALRAARAAQVERLLVVADARNRPAVALYESFGFQPIATRIAFVRLAHGLPMNRPNDAARQQ